MGNDPNRLPCSKFLENKRYLTFIHGSWPHDKDGEHAVTSRKVCTSPSSPRDLLSGNLDCGRRISVHPEYTRRRFGQMFLLWYRTQRMGA